jgi:hypothetical protein
MALGCLAGGEGEQLWRLKASPRTVAMSAPLRIAFVHDEL